ncbi:MAG: peptidyl-prolyl cis-trans isomerase, partial [Deltaproteobacteria bacterium]|nr:peptidyl-prolyl cis-trans isomerase [Deltaproteobacteria bacterium]
RARYPNLTQEDMEGLGVELRNQVLQTLVLETLLVQESERTGIVITPQELRREIERIPAFHNDKNVFDPAQYDRVLKAQNLMPGVFEDQIRRDMLLRKFQRFVGSPAFLPVEQAKTLFLYQAEQRVLEVMLFKTEEYLAQAAPDAATVAKYYESHPADFQVPAQADIQYVPVNAEVLSAAEEVSEAEIAEFYTNNQARYSRPERVHARHILILADKNADKTTDDAARTQIEDARSQILAGKDFAAVAQAISQDGSAQDGGDLGWFEKGRMVPEFEAAAFGLKPGALSEPVRSQFGWHLIRVDERAEADVTPLAEAQEDIRRSLALDRARPKVQEMLDALLIAVSNGQLLKEAAARHNLPVFDTGPQDAASLAQQLGLKPKDIQVIMAAPAGKTLDVSFGASDGYLIAHVTSSEPAATKSFDEVRESIETQLRLEKAQQRAQDAAVAARSGMTGSDVPKALQKRGVLTAQIGRDGIVSGFTAANPLLAEAVFTATGQDWLPAPYMMDTGAALVRVKEIVPPGEDVWKMVEGQLVDALANTKREKQYLSFLNGLRIEAKIEAVNMDLLERIR